MPISRRDLINRAALGGVGLVVAGRGEVLRTAAPAWADASASSAAGGLPPDFRGYGPLVDDPAGRLALPEGFRYRIVSYAGRTRLESGHYTPERHDGMATFPRPGGGTVIVYNHEVKGEGPVHPVPHIDGYVYDRGTGGGTTTLEVSRRGERSAEWVSLAGTFHNCAGGRTPWDTWLSCEETETRAGWGVADKDHGYVFEVDPYRQKRNRDPQPIKALGRFPHEAAVVKRRRGQIFQTEDAQKPNGLFYRWTAPRSVKLGPGVLRGLPADAGHLRALRASDSAGRHIDDLSRITAVGTRLESDWVDVPDRGARETSIRDQLRDSEVTRGRKLEGAWRADGGVYFVSSYARDESPGTPHDGQVWFHDPGARRLELVLRFAVNPRPGEPGRYDGPDNITVSPYGGLLIAEDGRGLAHLIGVNDKGKTYPIARNQLAFAPGTKPEFCGPCFSPDGTWLFANLQAPGIMYAITGPWGRR